MANEVAIFNQNDIELLSKYTQDNDFGSSDLSYAWLRIAQTNSPQATKGHEAFIKDLEPGMWFNSLTAKIYGPSIKVVYQKFFHSFSVHEPDGKNKFIRSMSEEEFEKGKSSGDVIFLKKGENGFRGKSGWYLGNDLVKNTANYMVALPDYPEDGVIRLGLSVAGAGKHINNWNTQLSNTFIAPGKKAPKFAFIWKLTLSLETKADGSYYTIGSGAKTTVEKIGPTPSSFMPQAISGYEFFQGLDAKIVADAGEVASDSDAPF
jgi:hypothetical protein